MTVSLTGSHYRVLRELGRGGMGVVVEAEDLKLGRHVALKFLPADLADNRLALERFELEARAASALNHPNICTIYEVGEDDGKHFIAMELLKGQSLDAAIAGSALPTDRILDIGIQLADALEAAHSHGIIHRDIKPANIFLTERRQVKVLDFGLAKTGSVAGVSMATASATLTSPGTTVGTIAYMSPEQARGDDLDARSDLFSAGAVLYQVATGRLPFEGGTSATMFDGILNREPAWPTHWNPLLPPRLAEIIVAALEKDRELRIQTAGELRAELKRLKRDLASGKTPADSSTSLPAATPATGSFPVPSSSRILLFEATRHKWMTAVSAGMLALLLCAAVFGVYQWLRPRSRAADEMSIVPMTRNGRGGAAAISPDGKFAAYILTTPNGSSLYVRQLAGGGDVEVLTGNSNYTLAHVVYSPEGSNFYVHRTKKGATHADDIVQVPVFGGSFKPIAVDVESAPAVSPDGRQIAFIRSYSESKQALVVTETDSLNERVLVTRQGENHLFANASAPNWSPDGKTIAFCADAGDKNRTAIVLVNVADGVQKEVYFHSGDLVYPVWLPDGKSLLFAAASSERNMRGQVYELTIANGSVRRITNDLLDYRELAISADGTALIAIQARINTMLFIGKDVHSLRELPTDAPENFLLSWLPDGRLLAYDWAAQPYEMDSNTGRRVTTKSNRRPCGRFVLLKRNDGWWRALPDETTATKTAIPADVGFPACSGDGEHFAYVHDEDGHAIARLVSSDGSKAVELGRDVIWLTLSADAKRAAFLPQAPRDKRPLVIVDAETGRTLHSFQDGTISFPRLAADGESVWYVKQRPIATLWRQRIAGGPAEKMLELPDDTDRIFAFDWSIDGKRFAMVRGSFPSDIVLMKNFR